MATAVVTRVKPVVSSVEKVVLTLSGREAAFLKHLVGSTAGTAAEAGSIFQALNEKLPGYCGGPRIATLTKEDVDKACLAYKI